MKANNKKEAEHERMKLILTSSPHIHSEESIPRIMFSVVGALIPAGLAAIYFFGLDALRVILICVASCLVCEALCQKIAGRSISIYDGSGLVTGLLLAYNLPSGSPWWMVVIGAIVAIVLGKQIYGGLGSNPFNPALVARVVLLISFPVQMTTWPTPRPLWAGTVDTLTGATPLGQMRTSLLLNKRLPLELERLNLGDLINPILGNIGGSLGEVSVIALLLGASFLLWRGYISWHIPITFVSTVFILTGIFHLLDPTSYAHPLFHLVTGGLVLGAFFMATDMVTTPTTTRGMLIFGTGCGLITVVIRLYGGYPEGVSFSILLMNGATPLIDRYCKPKKFGQIKK